MRRNFRFFIFTFFLVTCYLPLVTASNAKIYIDITSPALRKLPISFSSTGQKEAREITGVVKDDLDFTGIFSPVDPNVPGTEVTVKIEAELSNEKITANVTAYDLIENKEILRKSYETEKNLLRALAHTISNDIFNVITGHNGIFRTRITYIVDASEKKELRLMDWDGHNDYAMVSKGFTFSHNWSSDGAYLTYSSERNKEWGIYLLDLKNYRETLLFSAKGLNLVGGFSRGGNIAFSSSKDGSPEIYMMDINGDNLRKLTKSIGIDVSPVFSPDGSQIAFVSNRGGSPQIYIMSVDGSEIKRLTFHGNYNTSPQWSHDGKRIVYVGRKDGSNQIFMIELDNLEIKQLTDKGNNESPTFSPDSMFIAFDSDRDGKKGVYLMRVNGDGQKRITPKGVKALMPRWSPYLK